MCFYFKVKVNRYVLLYIEIFGVWIISIFGGIYVCVVFIKSIFFVMFFVWYLNKKK